MSSFTQTLNSLGGTAGSTLKPAAPGGIRIDNPASYGDPLKEALSWDGAAIVECVVDPHEPPIPSKATSDQVKKLFAALKAGTPNRNQIALQMVMDMLDASSFQASPGGHIPAAAARIDNTREDT